jgi:hypothetical protein
MPGVQRVPLRVIEIVPDYRMAKMGSMRTTRTGMRLRYLEGAAEL